MSKPYMTRMGAKAKFYRDVHVDRETRNAIRFYNLVCDMEVQGKFREWEIQQERKRK